MRRLPPFGSIQAFVHVARLGSLKAAADELALSSPALTRRIQALETSVGAPLFDRLPNGVHLNEHGKGFLAEIGPHLDGISEAVRRVGDGKKTTRIRIAVPSLFAAQRLVPALSSLRRSHPDLLVDVDTGANRIARLGDEVDAAVVIAEAVDDRLYSRVLETSRIIGVGSRSLLGEEPHLQASPALTRTPILLHREMPRAFDIWKDASGSPQLKASQVNYFDAGQLMLDAAAEGLGIAFMLEGHLAASTDTRLTKVFPKTAPSPYAYWFACIPSAMQRPAVRTFHDWLFENISYADPLRANAAKASETHRS